MTSTQDSSGRSGDERSLLFAGDVDEAGRPLPMTVAVLRARTAKWPVSPNTPDNIAELLARSRRMFVDGYYTYENFSDAVTRSLQAVEAALRVRLDAGQAPLFELIERAHRAELLYDEAREMLHIGRNIRNKQIHATTMQVWPPVMAANSIRTSHQLVAELFGGGDG